MFNLLTESTASTFKVMPPLLTFSIIFVVVCLAILTAIGFIVNYKFKDKLKGFLKFAMPTAVGLIIAFVTILLCLQLGNVQYSGNASDDLKASIKALKMPSVISSSVILGIIVIACIVINFVKRDKFKDSLICSVSLLFGFAVALASIFLFLQITRLSVKGEINTNFWLWFGFALLVVASVIVCSLIKLFKEKLFNIFAIVSTVLMVAYAITILCLYPQFDIIGSKALYIILSVVLVLAIILCALFTDKTKGTNNTKSLTYAGISIAIAYALSYIKIYDAPFGSSVTLFSMLPIMLYAYIFGTKKGVIAGLVYGVLQCLQDPQIYEPLQVMLDYPIAFSALGLAGVFKDKKFLKGNKILEFALGIIVAGVGRYSSSLISGYFVFGAWVEAGVDPILNSFVYNSPILIDAALDMAAGIFLYSSKSMSKYLSSINMTYSDGNVNNDEINENK